ncbi:FAD-binding oxidoreductase [Paenibacillus mendelii]|uniref:FAD-binding oxidoreductase n=1 Tax=Paenibacillus mendelii TaxID=206163 RepID=A0ABV6JCN2_9BACL|nr:FAD-binding oxidoreductase [Paenibacillus mendelii]MCQ6563858.1 hypothetical protein [Paenibacillus mendelii]
MRTYDANPIFQSMPDAMLLPGTTQEEADILRGSGTNLAGGTILVRGGIVLNMNKLI